MKSTILIALLLLGCEAKPTQPPTLLEAETAANKGYVRMCYRIVWKTEQWGPFFIRVSHREYYPCGGEYSRGFYDQGGNKIVPDSSRGGDSL